MHLANDLVEQHGLDVDTSDAIAALLLHETQQIVPVLESIHDGYGNGVNVLGELARIQADTDRRVQAVLHEAEYAAYDVVRPRVLPTR